MTYKGVYRDGIVILQGDIDLQNGAHVTVNPAKVEGRGRAGKGPAAGGRAKAARAAKRPKQPAKLPGIGLWKDRWPKSMSSADIARELRERVSRRVS